MKQSLLISGHLVSFQADKVQFILNIKDIPVKDARNAEMALLCGNPQDAEAILLQASLVFRAIMLNIHLYNWDRSVCFRGRFLCLSNMSALNLSFRWLLLSIYSKTSIIRPTVGLKEGGLNTEVVLILSWSLNKDLL